jgi:hypothetical protein
MASEYREALAPHLGHRIKIRGVVGHPTNGHAPRDQVADLMAAVAFCKACGGPAKAAEVISALPDMPRQLLRELLAVLAEGGDA